MNFLDVRTVMFSHLVTDALCTAVLVFLWGQNRKRFAGTFYWVLDFAFQTTAALLIVLRGSVPDWASMDVSNTLVVLGALLGYWGLSRFAGVRSRQIHNGVLLAAFIVVHLYFTFIRPSLAARNLNVSLGLLAMCFQCVWLVMRRVGPGMRGMTRWVGLVFGVFCLVSIVRIVVVLASPPASNDFFRSGSYDKLLLMSYQALLILLTFALALMINQRLLGEIRTQEEKYAKAFRSSPYAITLTRPSDGLMLEVNDGFVKITGYPAGEAVGKTTRDLKLWASEEDRAAVVDELSRAHRVGEREFLFRKRSGELLTGLFSAEIITIGDQPWILSSINDITERKRAEEALRRHAERLRILHDVDQAVLQAVDPPDAIARTALEHLRGLLSCQSARIDIFDLETREVQASPAGAGAETVARTGADLELLRHGNPEIVEDVSRTGSPPASARALPGEGVRAFVNAPLLTERGLIGVLTIGWEDPRAISREETDVAAEVAAEIAIAIEQSRLRLEARRSAADLEQRVTERTAQLEGANKELEAFAYSVSHDLRSPLRAIDGYTRILLEDHGSCLNAEGKRVCTVISESARDMGRLIDDLLSFSRLARAAVQPSSVDMEALAEATFMELVPATDRERILFRRGPLPAATGDPGMLRQVWMNLLSNAIKFSSRRERPVIEAYSNSRQGDVVYSIRDNGAGFDMHYVDKLFGVFQRLHSQKEFEGTGVGLAIVQRIVHRHGGRVWAEGETDGGATFHFTIGKAV